MPITRKEPAHKPATHACRTFAYDIFGIGVLPTSCRRVRRDFTQADGMRRSNEIGFAKSGNLEGFRAEQQAGTVRNAMPRF